MTFSCFLVKIYKKTQHPLCAHNRSTWACKRNWTDRYHIMNCVPNLRRVGWVKSAHMDPSSDCHYCFRKPFRGKCVSFFTFDTMIGTSPVCCGCYPGWGCIIIPIGSPGDLVQLARHEWLSRTRNWKSQKTLPGVLPGNHTFPSGNLPGLRVYWHVKNTWLSW